MGSFSIQALLKLEDAKIIEAVGIPVEEARGINRLTVCVSTQVFISTFRCTLFFSVVCFEGPFFNCFL